MRCNEALSFVASHFLKAVGKAVGTVRAPRRAHDIANHS